MLPRAVLFDLDGTLIDSIPLILSSMKHAFEGHPNAPGVAEWVALIGTPLDGMIRRWAGDEADVLRVKERYKVHQWAHHDAMVRAFPGVPEMLDALAARGVRMAVVTSKLEPSARRSLDFLGLARHFECVVGLEATERHKPDPAPVRYALQGLGARPEEGAFVGDSPHDVLAGNAAGVATVAALWGPFSREELAKAGPRAWAERVGDVMGVLEGLA
jgi:pyrophosphatase PpaX